MKFKGLLIITIVQFTCFVICSQAQDCSQWANVSSGTTWRYEIYTSKGKLFKGYANKVDETFKDSIVVCRLTSYSVRKNGKWLSLGSSNVEFEDELYKISMYNQDGSISMQTKYLCNPRPGDKQKDYNQADVYLSGSYQYTFSIKDIYFGEEEDVTCPAGTFTCVPMHYLRNDGGNPSIITEWINNDIGTIKSTAANHKGKIAFTTMLVEYKK